MPPDNPAKTTKDRYTLHRFIDRWIGGALLYVLGLVFFRKRKPPQPIRSILLMKFDGLGDLVLVTAIANDLRAAFPYARIVLLCGPFNHPLASLLTTFDRLVVLNVANPLSTVFELRRLAPDVCIDLGEWSRLEALLSFFSRAKWTIGFETRGQHRHYAYDCTRPLRFDQHELDNYRSLLKAMGVPTERLPRIDLTDSAHIALEEAKWKKPFAVLHLWSGSATWSHLKEWPRDRWLELARWLNGKGLAVCLTGGKSDAERTQDFMADCQWPDASIESLCGLPFPKLLAILQKATLVVSIDTSITHMAAALGTRVLSLHGPSHSKRWGPIGRRAYAIDSTCPGCGYMNWGADSDPERARLQCMEAIAVTDVQAKIDEMLAANETRSGECS